MRTRKYIKKNKKFNSRHKFSKKNRSRRSSRIINVNKRWIGGVATPPTEELSPISYREDEYDQLKNALNYKP